MKSSNMLKVKNFKFNKVIKQQMKHLQQKSALRLLEIFSCSKLGLKDNISQVLSTF